MAEPFHYQGFSSPNGTIVPDDVFDLLAPRLTEAELRVLLYIIRRTFGFKKDSDSISLKQMVEGIRTKDGRVLDLGAGVAKSAAVRAARGLQDKGVVIATRNRSSDKGDQPTTYQLRFRVDPVFSKRTRGSLPNGHGGVLPENPQETALQETVRQQTERDSLRHSSSESLISNIRNGNTEIGEPKKSETTTTPRDNIPTQHHVRSSVSTAAPVASALPRGVTTLSAVLPHRIASRSKVPSEARQAIGAYIRDFALEFGDEAPLRSTVTRAVHLYENCGLSIGDFIGRLHAARSVVKEYSGNVKKRKGDASRGWKPANKVPYFFAVLEDQLGLRDKDDATEQAVGVGDNQSDRVTVPPAASAAPDQPQRRTVGGPLVRVGTGQAVGEDGQSDGATFPSAPSASHEPPQWKRKTIGGPLVRVAPTADNDDQDLERAPSGPATRGSRTTQKRPKSGRVPVIASNEPLRRTGP